MFLTYATSSLYQMGLCTCERGCVSSLCVLNTRRGFFFVCPFQSCSECAEPTLAQSLCTLCNKCCVTSAQMCISIREPLTLPSTQTCTSNRGPVPPSVPTCTREAPAPCLRLDKARYLHISRLCCIHFPGQCDRLLVGLHSLLLSVTWKTVLASLFSLWCSVCLLIMSQ